MEAGKYIRVSLLECRERPSRTLRDLGVVFDAWVPQTVADQIWIYGARGVPDTLPPGFIVYDEMPRGWDKFAPSGTAQ